jgi:hypothetical protein
LEVVDGQGRCLAVSSRDFVDDADGAGVVAFAHEEFGGLVDGEADEA